MLKQKARNIDDLKTITYGYAGCPVSIKNINYNVFYSLFGYIFNEKHNYYNDKYYNDKYYNDKYYNDKNKFIRDLFWVFYK